MRASALSINASAAAGARCGMLGVAASVRADNNPAASALSGIERIVCSPLAGGYEEMHPRTSQWSANAVDGRSGAVSGALRIACRFAPSYPFVMRASPSTLELLRRRWPIILLAWALPAALAALETWTFWRMAGRSYPFWRAVAMEGPAWLVYAMLTPFIFILARSLPIARPRLVRNTAVHLLIALTAGAAYAVIATAASQYFTPIPNPRPFGRMAFMWYLSALPLTTLAYFCIFGVGVALIHFADSKQREVHAATLTAQLADARLAALRMQLHPHFLFNTLNAITVLARDRQSAAVVRMLELLSELLRDVLRADRGKEIPLADELAFVRRYLDIELVRFADRLTVREDVDLSLANALVPAFLLQPLVENALRHGIAPSSGQGTIVIGARAEGATLVLSVEDRRVLGETRGVSAQIIGADNYGVGLSNTAARLDALFGNEAVLDVGVVDASCTRASIRLPLRRDELT